MAIIIEGAYIRQMVVNENPQLQPDGTWKLGHIPGPAGCLMVWYGGLLQTLGQDYTVKGQYITNSFWSDPSNPALKPVCLYTY